MDRGGRVISGRAGRIGREPASPEVGPVDKAHGGYNFGMAWWETLEIRWWEFRERLLPRVVLLVAALAAAAWVGMGESVGIRLYAGAVALVVAGPDVVRPGAVDDWTYDHPAVAVVTGGAIFGGPWLLLGESVEEAVFVMLTWWVGLALALPGIARRVQWRRDRVGGPRGRVP